MTSKLVRIAVYFEGDGRVRSFGQWAFSGGVVPPTLGPEVGYSLRHTTTDEDGLFGPEPGAPGVEDTFQLNLVGTTLGFRELGRYFLGLAELDTSADPDHHQHFDGVRSTDGRTVIDIIARKKSGADGHAV